MQRPWVNTFCWLVPYGLIAYFSYTAQDHQARGDTATVDWFLSLIDEENSLQICLQEI